MSNKITKELFHVFTAFVCHRVTGGQYFLDEDEIEDNVNEFLNAYADEYKLVDDDSSASSGSSPSAPVSPRRRAPKRRSSSGSSDDGSRKRFRFYPSDSDDSDSDNRPATARVLASDSDSDSDSDRQRAAQPMSDVDSMNDVEPSDDEEQSSGGQDSDGGQSSGGQSSAGSGPGSPLVQDSWGDRIVTRSMTRQRLAQEARRAARAAQVGGRATAQAAARGQSGVGSGAAGSGAAGSGASGSGASGSGVRQPAAVNQPAPPVGPTCYHCGISLIVNGTQPQRPALCVLCGRYRPRGQTGANRQPLAIDWSGRLVSERPPATIQAYVTRQTREHGGVQPQQVYTGT